MIRTIRIKLGNTATEDQDVDRGSEEQYMQPENMGSMKTIYFIKVHIDLVYSNFNRVNNETKMDKE